MIPTAKKYMIPEFGLSGGPYEFLQPHWCEIESQQNCHVFATQIRYKNLLQWLEPSKLYIEDLKAHIKMSGINLQAGKWDNGEGAR
jgi:hypothetical protein